MKYNITILILFISVSLSGQTQLDDYISYGLQNNLALKQKLWGYRKSMEALREARGLFYPKISLEARYTISEGGRVIDFPVGDLLNPVYNTLNALTSSQMFPEVENQQIRFLRPTEHETKIRVVQPIINTDIYYNSKIKKELSLYEEADMGQYKRELVADIKKSYYNLNMADGILSMLQETRKLLLENIRINKKLFENDKVTRENIFRSEAELGKFDQQLQNAEKDRKVALAYFNFLLNRPLNDSVKIEQPAALPLIRDLTGNFTQSALENREEIRKLQQYSNVADLQVKMNQASMLPDMFIAVDYGYQGEQYQFNKSQDYVQASAIMSWNLFSGFQNRAKIKQAVMDKSVIDAQMEEVKKQIELQVLNTLNNLLTAEKGISAAEKRLVNAREVFRLVSRKYEENQASLIEFLDARTTLTEAEENMIVSKFQYLSAYADFEKVTATENY
jgi:outer membrane protein